MAGRPDFSRDGKIEPGVDCPHGSSVAFASEDRTKVAVARQKWRSQQEIDWIAAPPGLETGARSQLDPLLYLGPGRVASRLQERDRDLRQSLGDRRSLVSRK
jgi:hypothetical protein